MLYTEFETQDSTLINYGYRQIGYLEDGEISDIRFRIKPEWFGLLRKDNMRRRIRVFSGELPYTPEIITKKIKEETKELYYQFRFPMNQIKELLVVDERHPCSSRIDSVYHYFKYDDVLNQISYKTGMIGSALWKIPSNPIERLLEITEILPTMKRNTYIPDESSHLPLTLQNQIERLLELISLLADHAVLKSPIPGLYEMIQSLKYPEKFQGSVQYGNCILKGGNNDE